MCDSVDDTLSNLSSDKITVRVKGRKSCSELIKADFSGESYINDDEWKEILVASISGASKDAHVASKKEKSPDIEVAVFMRKLIKHVVQNTIWIAEKKLQLLAKHCLEVLYSAFPAPYKDEYKHILCEILEPKISSFLNFNFLSEVQIYLRESAFLTQRAYSENSNLKLLKQFCKALFTDECKSTDLLKTLLNWFGDNLLPSVREDNLQSLALMTAAVADCCVYIMQYQGSNFFHYSKNILVSIIRQLSLSKLRDSHRDSYLRFLFSYIKLSTSINMSENDEKNGGNPISPVNDFPPLPEKNPLNESLQTLCEILTADDALRALIVYCQVRQSHLKSSYVNYLTDTKVQCNLQITAMIVVLHQQQYALQKSELSCDNDIDAAISNNSSGEGISSSSSDNNNVTHSNYSENNSCNKNNKMEFTTNNNNSKCYNHKKDFYNEKKQNDGRACGGKRSYEEYIDTEDLTSISKNQIGCADYILERIQFFSFLNSNSNSNSKVSPNSKLIRNSTKIGPIQGRLITSASLEGLILLVTVMTKMFPKGEFLKSNKKDEINKIDNNKGKTENKNFYNINPLNIENKKNFMNSYTKMKLHSAECSCVICECNSLLYMLSKWISVVGSKLFETLPLLEEQQLQGSVLLALNGLAFVTKEIFKKIKNKKNINNIDEKFVFIRILWTKIVNTILVDNTFNRNLKICREHSISECAFELMNTIIKNDLIITSSTIQIFKTIQELSSFQDVRGVRSPHFLNLFSSIIQKSDFDNENSICKNLMYKISNSTYMNIDVRSIVNDDNEKNERSIDPNISIFQYLSTNLNYFSNDDDDDDYYDGENNNNDNNNNNENRRRCLSNSDRGMIYIACFLDEQINDDSSARLTVQLAGDLSLALNEILIACLGLNGDNQSNKRGK